MGGSVDSLFRLRRFSILVPGTVLCKTACFLFQHSQHHATTRPADTDDTNRSRDATCHSIISPLAYGAIPLIDPGNRNRHTTMPESDKYDVLEKIGEHWTSLN